MAVITLSNGEEINLRETYQEVLNELLRDEKAPFREFTELCIIEGKYEPFSIAIRLDLISFIRGEY